MNIREFILGSGFEGALDGLIAYAETQAKLHHSLGDGRRPTEGHREQWIFWVRAWANLQRSADRIALGGDEQDCLSMWKQCHEDLAQALDFDFSDSE